VEDVKIFEMLYVDDNGDNCQNRKIYNSSLESRNMQINKQKTKTMIISRNEKIHEIKIEDTKLEQAKNFKNLSSIIRGHYY
jgi:hypothetical protein